MKMTLRARGGAKTRQNIQELFSKQLLSTLVTQRDGGGEKKYVITHQKKPQHNSTGLNAICVNNLNLVFPPSRISELETLRQTKNVVPTFRGGYTPSDFWSCRKHVESTSHYREQTPETREEKS